MAGLTKIEDFLIELGVSYEEIGPSTFLVDDSAKGLPRIVVAIADPIVVLRADVVKAPTSGREAFFAELLKLNCEDLIHGAYALDGEEVILVDTLEYESMERSEFQASLEAIGFALAQHYPLLAPFTKN